MSVSFIKVAKEATDKVWLRFNAFCVVYFCFYPFFFAGLGVNAVGFIGSAFYKRKAYFKGTVFIVRRLDQL